MAKGVRISIDVNELHRLARDLNGTGERLRRGRQKFIRDHLVTYLEQSTEEAFEEQENPETGEKWEEWTERYRKHVAKLFDKNGHSGKKLQKSGALKGSIIVTSDEASAGISSNLPYAAIHQLGGTEELALERYS